MCKGNAHRGDLCQILAVSSAFCGIVVQLVYLSAVGIASRRFISDGLVSDVWYRFCQSVFEIATLLFCLFYFWRHREGKLKVASLGGGFAGGAIKSWVALVAIREDLFPTLHGIATLAFVVNAGACNVFLLVLDVKEHEYRNDRYHLWYLSLGVTIILTGVGLGLFLTQSPHSWIFEQISFLLFNISQLLFFVYHPFTCREPYAPVALHYSNELYSLTR